MKILITGGSGFVGRQLSAFLLQRGHRVTAVGYRKHNDLVRHKDFDYIQADTSEPGTWQEAAGQADAVVNLAGQTIFKRWSRRYKQAIYDSRILTTRHVVDALPENRGVVLCSTSAVGYYGDRKDDLLTESEPPGSDFLARVGRDWEAEAFAAEKKNVRVVAARFGIVLGKNGGALAKMIPAFKSFAGGPIGTGRQWFPWIHMDDVTAAIGWVLENAPISGPVNFCAPHPVRNKKLAATLGKILHRPAVMPAPALMIRLALGEMASALLASQRAVPEILTRSGFVFQYPEIEPALASLIR